MENLFKQAQNAGIALERRAASETVNVSSYDTSPDTGFYQQSKLNKGVDLSGAFKGLEKLVENEAEYRRTTDFVEGQLDAQTGKALDDNEGKWTTRGYKSFQKSSDINKFIGNTVGRMDEFAEQSPAAFQQYLKESFDEMAATEEDPFIQKQLSEMFTKSSDALIKQHTKAREELNKTRTINSARENVVNSLYASGGKVTDDVLKTIKQTKGALPTLEAYGVIADAAYVSMIENGQTGLYEHLEKGGYFDKLDTNTRATLIRTYESITKAKEEAATEANQQIYLANMIERGGLGNNAFITDKEKNDAVNAWLLAREPMYDMSEEGNRQRIADIIEMSVKNNYYSHPAAKSIQNMITNPVAFVEGKPVLRAESMDAFVAAWKAKKQLGKNGDAALATFMDEDTRLFLEQVNDATDYGVDAATPDQLRTAIMKVYDANNKRDEKKQEYATYLKSADYENGLKILDNKIKDMNGQGILGEFATFTRETVLPGVDIFGVQILPASPAKYRGLPVKNPEFVKNSYQRVLQTEIAHASNAEVAAKRAAYKVASRTHNVLGNYVEYNPVVRYESIQDQSGRVVQVPRTLGTLSQYFGLNPGDDDDDISEELADALLSSTDGKLNKTFKNNLKDMNISLNTERDTITFSFDYDSRNWKQKLSQMPAMDLFFSDAYIADAEMAENDRFYTELPVQLFRDYFSAKSKDLEQRMTKKGETLYGKEN